MNMLAPISVTIVGAMLAAQMSGRPVAVTALGIVRPSCLATKSVGMSCKLSVPQDTTDKMMDSMPVMQKDKDFFKYSNHPRYTDTTTDTTTKRWRACYTLANKLKQELHKGKIEYSDLADYNPKRYPCVRDQPVYAVKAGAFADVFKQDTSQWAGYGTSNIEVDYRIAFSPLADTPPRFRPGAACVV